MNVSAMERTMAAPSITATAPAKINLTLDVLSCREDGYHELRSLVIGVELCDRIRCRARSEPGVELACSDRTLMRSDNLAHRAALGLARHVGRDPAVRIDLDKRIPVAAGLGGGSSDAATTLILCNELWKTGLDDDTLARIGADIGSDVPLFFSLPAAVIKGRGERVERVALRWSGWVLLVSVGVPVSTAEVFRAWRREDSGHDRGGADTAIVEATSAEALMGLLSNHLERAVFRVSPAVARACDELNRAGVGPMYVTGAGSTLFRLFDEKEAACRAAGQVVDLQIGVTASVVAAPVGPASMVNEES